MYPYKRMLVGMNLTDQDRASIRYAGFVTGLTGSEEIVFLHVTENPDIPEEVLRDYPQVLEAAAEAAQETLEEIVQDETPPDLKVQTSCVVRSGLRIDTMLSEIRDREIDLVVVGKKAEDRAGGVLTEKIARKAPCSVLFLPEDQESRLSSIVVATDFSGHSTDALDEGIALATAAGIAEIRCVHVYRVPLGFSRTGMSFEQFARVMHRNAEREFETFLEGKGSLDVQIKPVMLLGGHPSWSIGELLEKEPTDLLIVGARGRSVGAAVLLGSVTERLVRRTCCPLLAVKRKGAGMGLLDALFSG